MIFDQFFEINHIKERMVHMKTPSKPYMSKAQTEFNHLYKELDDIYHDAALNTSLSDSAFHILYGIFALGNGCLQRDICKTSCIPKQTINSSIRKLENEGWIKLVPGKGRSMQIFLTDEGQHAMQEKIYPIIKAENNALEALTSEECEQMILLYRKYNTALRKEFLAIHRKE